MRFDVNNDDLSKALTAVSAHAYQKDDFPELATVMFNVNANNELLLTASGGQTSAVAVVPVMDSDGDLTGFALALKDVKAISSVFHSAEQLIRFEHEPGKTPSAPLDDSEVKARLGRLLITDVSGLIHGKQLRIRPADVSGRDVTQLWHTIAIRRQLKVVPRRTAVASKELALFKTAAAVYKEPLIVEMGDGHGNLIIRCGPSFIGYLAKANLEPETLSDYEQFREDWADRLPTRMSVVKDGS